VCGCSQPRALLPAGWLHRAANHDALPQPVFFDHRAGHEGIAALAAISIVGAAEKAVAVGVHLQEAVAGLQRNLVRLRSKRIRTLGQWQPVFAQRGRSARGGLAAEGRAVLAILIVTPPTHAAILTLSVIRPLPLIAVAATPPAAATITGTRTAAAVSAGTKPLFSHLHTRKRCA